MTRSPFPAAGTAILALALAAAAAARPSGNAVLTRAPSSIERSPRGLVEQVLEDGRSGFGYLRRASVPCLTTEQRARIQATLTATRRRLLGKGLTGASPQRDLRFRWPLRAVGVEPGQFGTHGVSNFVDHDFTGPNNLVDYECGIRTYDLVNGYDHRGTDFFTWPFPWHWMDDETVQVVAVAPGTIVWRADGNFDESCGLAGGDWNAVYVRHADGSMVWYGHLKNGSVTQKTVGQQVVTGEYLGVVGSSGNSTGPHLHLEVYDDGGNLVDPFAGPCNGLNARTRWLDQRPYYDSSINRLLVGDAPVDYPSCPGRVVTHEVSVVTRGTLAFFTTFYRDQLDSQLSLYRLRRPSGTLYDAWNHSSSAPHYAASWWWWSRTIDLGEETGVWTFEVEYEGRTYAIEFLVV